MSMVLQTVVCPECRGHLSRSDELLRCASCEATYRIEDGVPDVRPAHDAGSLAQEQARFYDNESDPEWEIQRPASAPRLYRWLMAEKFRRSVSAIQQLLPGATALTVCGGSGMDAEFLASRCTAVVASDVSEEAARRALVRSREHGVDFEAIAADVHKLPFPDRSIDLVYVHDGLHHLEQPLDGLREMARVARVAISITEPADAAATKLATHIGVAQQVEEAGNRVARLDALEIASVLSAAGFNVVASDRYGMFYRHKPGWAMRLFSRPGFYEMARLGFRVGNGVAGGLGNKLTVQAVRAR